ncbi:MAG: tRNA pseudouridine(55) synthase TruB [Gemmatimonadales bacterium]
MDKPAGWTSHDVVAVVRRQLGTREVGHAGTLDPFATGLLVVLVGRATRLSRFVEAMPKQYRAVVRFGRVTDTHDPTGVVTAEQLPEHWPERADLAELLSRFLGKQEQRPPAYSAKHVNCTRAHTLARRGEVLDLPEVPVEIHRLEIMDWSPPDLTLDATVGRGTYLRALARDLGATAGIPAHCAALRRTAIGPFTADDAVAPLDAGAERLQLPAAMVPMLVSETVNPEGARELGFGRRVAQQRAHEGNGSLLAGDGRLLAIAEGRGGWWHPVVVLEPAS